MMIIKRKHLEKAVLLSLLLTNVCRLGGATEYEKPITGSETDYDSLKSTVGDTTKYTFSDGDVIKVPASVGDKDTFASVTLKGTDKKIEINSAVDLTLTGKGKPVGAVSAKNIDVGAVDGASLTFSGETVTVEDISKQAKYDVSILVGAKNGGSVVFENKHTVISKDNLYYNLAGLHANNGKIEFTENAETLDIGAGTGIEVYNDGIFEFNNSAGIVNIANSYTGISMNSGTVTLKGKETIINTVLEDDGGTAVTVSINKAADNNTVNFDADKTVLKGMDAGIYVNDFGSSYTGSTVINFAGEADLTAVDGEYGSDAIYTGSKAEINFAKNAELKSASQLDGSSVYGARIQQGSALKAQQGLTVSATAAGKKDAYNYPANAVGLKTYDADSEIDVTGAVKITAAAVDGAATALQNWSGGTADFKGTFDASVSSIDGAATGVSNWQGSSATFDEQAVIKVNSQNAGATGVLSQTANSTVDFKGKTVIKIGNSDAGATKAGLPQNKAAAYNYGVIASDTGKVTFEDDAVIDVSGVAENTLTKGVYAYSKGSVDFTQGLVLDNQKGNDHSLYANNEGTVIKVNSSGSGDVYLTGSIRADNAGLVNVQLNNAASYYKGATTEVNKGQVELRLQNGALWDVTDNSSLSKLDFGSDAVVDLRQQAGGQKLSTAALTGSGGTFVLGVDLSKGEADQLQIGDSMENTVGHYNLKVEEINFKTGDDLHLVLVEDASGKHTFTAQDLYKGGIFNYKSEISNEGGSKWYLESIKREVTQDAASVLQTANSLYSGWMLGSDNLEGRLGELRQIDTEHGLWARINRGKMRGEAFKNNYQTYQIGYDAAFKDGAGSSVNDWIGGVAFEYAKGSIGYGIGSGENKTAAVLLYGTRHSQAGDKVDIVLKHGQIKSEFDTFGFAADSGNYKNRASLFSVEYGKRLQRPDGSYLEPQAQLTLGHINGDSYVTDMGIDVATAGINSAVGRLGLELGKKYSSGSAWVKVSALHEFDGKTETSLHIDDENFTEWQNYSGTWCELALGGNVNLSKDNELYFDVARSFGGDFQKQWQLNAGLRWSF